jgi:iron complex outermembrane recepter protein
MSELTFNGHRRAIYRHFLSTVSVFALLGMPHNAAKADGDGVDNPTVWIELGGDLERFDGQGDNFPVGFLANNPASPVLKPVSPFEAENPPPFNFTEEGKLTVQPEDSSWSVSAAIRYGRSSNFKRVLNQTNKIFYRGYRSGHPSPTPQTVQGTEDFADTQSHRHQSHMIVDFSAGKDVGLGLFGRNSSSSINLGVRFAQFTSGASLDIRARPDLGFKYASVYGGTLKLRHFHTYHLTGQASRSFHGVGPSLSWNGSAAVLGNPQQGEATLDWGVNAALLFGRQRARVQHLNVGRYSGPTLNKYYTTNYHVTSHRNSARTVTVPNVGGFAGVSYRIENFKVSAGYRADLFFGAIDGGIDAAKKENVGFYGPFASVSVGIGG